MLKNIPKKYILTIAIAIAGLSATGVFAAVQHMPAYNAKTTPSPVSTATLRVVAATPSSVQAATPSPTHAAVSKSGSVAPSATPKPYFSTFHEYQDIPVLMSFMGSIIPPTCTTITFTATLHAVEAATMTYYWKNNEGQTSPTKQLVFAGAGEQTISWTTSHPITQHLEGTVTLYETSPNVRTVPLGYDWSVPDSCFITPMPPPTATP